MVTPILQIITQYCMEYTHDDPQMMRDMVDDKALFAYRSWRVLQASIPLFSCPPTMQKYLVGTQNSPLLMEPQFESYTFTANEELNQSVTVNLGAEYANHDIFSAREELVDDFGNVDLLPVDYVTYDKATGAITVNASEEQPIAKGTTIDINFYTDGWFVNDLSAEMKKILGLCYAVTWTMRLFNDYVDLVPKVVDKSFQIQNQANKQRADMEKLAQARRILAEEMRRFEQNLQYEKIVSPYRHLI